jgi:hypothetical protein
MICSNTRYRQRNAFKFSIRKHKVPTTTGQSLVRPGQSVGEKSTHGSDSLNG